MSTYILCDYCGKSLMTEDGLVPVMIDGTTILHVCKECAKRMTDYWMDIRDTNRERITRAVATTKKEA